MSGFLTRLAQRTQGELPVATLLERPGYSETPDSFQASTRGRAETPIAPWEFLHQQDKSKESNSDANDLVDEPAFEQTYLESDDAPAEDKKERQGKRMQEVPASSVQDHRPMHYLTSRQLVRADIADNSAVSEHAIEHRSIDQEDHSGVSDTPEPAVIGDDSLLIPDVVKHADDADFGGDDFPLITRERSKGAEANSRQMSDTSVADLSQSTQNQSIEINIGRLEVRAVTPEAKPQGVKKPAAPSTLTLSDYLQQRQRGER